MPQENEVDAARLRAAHGQQSATGRFPFGGAYAHINKTAAYAIQVADLKAGALALTNFGAVAAVTATLPTPNASLLGARVRFVGVANFAIALAAPTAGTLLVLNNAAATSLTSGTLNTIVGSVLEAVCIQTGASTYQWAAFVASVGATGTVA